MSAYALPGSIFPPMSGFNFESTYVMSTSVGESSSQQLETSTGPQHAQVSPFASPFQFKPVDFSSMQSSPIAPNSPLTPARPATTSLEESGEETCSGGSTREVGISVKDAKIDPVRLVKSLTTVTKNRKRDSNAPTTKQPEVSTGKKDSSSIDNSDCNSQEEDDPHKDAIQFELNISFNGRTYSATRTLPRIIQLRNDLISEISIRRSKALRRMRWIKKRPKADFDVEDDDVTVVTVNDDEDEDVKIPELPDYYSAEERSSSGGRGRGFTLLHALLRSYCPVMEGWLLKVADLAPDSPSLSNFLWEPVSGSNMRSTNSFSTLISIKEDESEDEHEEEEDDVFAF